LATELARQGTVVFATDMRAPYLFHIEKDAECGYRLTRTIAEEYGGDLEQPVTMVGYSLGAPFALRHGLSEESFGPVSIYDVGCPPGAPRPDVIIPINGCHQTPEFDYESVVRYWGNKEADVVVVSGSDDTVCATRHSEHAEEYLESAGYDVTLVEVADANHWEVIFHDLAYGNYKTLPADHAAGQETVKTILDAIEAPSSSSHRNRGVRLRREAVPHPLGGRSHLRVDHSTGAYHVGEISGGMLGG